MNRLDITTRICIIYNEKYMIDDNMQKYLRLPFIGRDDELKILKENLQSAFNYQGKCVFISGEAGIGKTRLIDEFLKSIDFVSVCFNIQLKPQTTANSLFIEVISNYLHKSGRPIREIVYVVGKCIYYHYYEQIPELRLYFPFEPIQKQQDFFEIYQEFVEFIGRLSEFAPVILILEEIQNGDKDIYKLLSNLLHQITNLPVLVLLTSDNIKLANELPTSYLIRIELQNLKEDEILKLNKLLFADNLKEKFFYWLFQVTKGFPLLLHQYFIALVEKGVIYYDDSKGRWCTLPNYDKIPVYEGIPEILKIRFADLNNGELSLLEIASVIEEQFNLSSPINGIKENILSSLIKKGILIKERDNYTFSHHIIREIIYSNIPERKKIQLHKKFGEFFKRKNNKLNAINHLMKAKVYEPWMVEFLLNLAGKMNDSKDLARANAYIEQALVIAQRIKNFSNKDLLNILARYAHIKLKVGLHHEAITSAEKYLKLSKKIRTHDKRQLLEVYSSLINALIRIGKYDEAIKNADAILSGQKKLMVSPVSDLLIDIMTMKAFALKYCGEFEKALEIGLQLKNQIKSSTSLLSQYYIYNLLGSIFNSLANYPKAIEYRLQTLKIAEKIGSPFLIAAAKGNLGISYINNCEFKKGEEFLLSHREFSIKSGIIREQIMAFLNLGACYLFRGYLERAIEEFKNGIKLCQGTNNQTDIIWLLKYYGIALMFKEDYNKALDSFDSGLKLTEKTNNPKLQFTIKAYKGMALYILKQWAEANKLVNEIKKIFGEKYQKEGLYHLLAGINLKTDSRRRWSLINKALSIVEQNKDYTELFFISYFCGKFLNIDDYATICLNKAKQIAQKFEMTGWLERMESETKKIYLPVLEVFSLGHLNIKKSESEFPVRELLNWQKLRDLFSILIVSKFDGRPRTRDEIALQLWPDLSKKQVANNFHVSLSQLKKIIGKEYIMYQNYTYSLHNVWLDAIEFRGLINKAQNLYSQGKLHTAEECLNNAIALYKGSFLEDCYGIWIEETREQLNRLYRQALFLLSEIYLKKLRFEEVIETIHKILISDPLDEEAHRFLMRVYILSNEKAKAIEQYKRCEELFNKEYECLPSEETRRLYEEIKNS